MLAPALLFAALVAPQQDPASAAVAEAKARADLGHAVQHIDEVLRLATETRDRARMAQALATTTHATATQVDRARLAKLAGDLAAQLAALEQTLAAHTDTLRAMRGDLVAEAPPPAAGGVTAFREAMLAARKLPTADAAAAKLRELEQSLLGSEVRNKPGAAAALGHARYLLADALREGAQARALGLFQDASKKLDEVLAGEDPSDTGEGTSLHAAALRRKVEIHGKLFLAYQAKMRAEPGLAAKAREHGDKAESAFKRLGNQFGEAMLPSGERVVDAARASIERMRPQVDPVRPPR
jgi:hypothetical protein